MDEFILVIREFIVVLIEIVLFTTILTTITLLFEHLYKDTLGE